MERVEPNYPEYERRLTEIIEEAGYSLEGFIQAMKYAGYPRELTGETVREIMRGSPMPVPFSYYAAIVLGLDRDERLELAKLRFGLAFEDER